MNLQPTDKALKAAIYDRLTRKKLFSGYAADIIINGITIWVADKAYTIHSVLIVYFR